MHSYIYGMMRECMGLEGPGDFAGLQWYIVDFLIRDDFTRLGGVWTKEPRRILLDRYRTWMHPAYISHEILHDLGVEDHDNPAFERCTIREIEAP